MSSRTDRYKQLDSIPTRSNKNKELYKQIYNAYDEFENLIVPSNTREINPKDLNKVIASRQDYHRRKEYDEIVNREEKNASDSSEEDILLEKKDVYDINELLNKAVSENKKPEFGDSDVLNNDYLKKLKLDSSKTNIEQVKELYSDIQEESEEELMKTANFSLEILSDLKGNNDNTMVDAPPIKEEALPHEDNEKDDFYSDTYKFSKEDFDDMDDFLDDEEVDELDKKDDSGSGKFFFKIMLLIFGILFIILVLLYFINYFNRV